MGQNEDLGDMIDGIGLISIDECRYLIKYLKSINLDNAAFPLKIYSEPRSFLIFFRKRHLFFTIRQPDHIITYLERINSRLEILKIIRAVAGRVRGMTMDEIIRESNKPFPKLGRNKVEVK